MTAPGSTRSDAVIHGSQATADVAAEAFPPPSVEARYARARLLAREIKQLLGEMASTPDYTARLACGLAGDLADVLDELERSIAPR